MTDLAIKYVGNPIADFFRSLIRSAELSGMARAAYELKNLGYHKEADEVLERMRKSI